MPTLNDLGKKVKAKYPGQYDDMSDLEVGRRTLATYPEEYADFAGADTNRVVVRNHERNKPQKKFVPESGQPEIKAGQKLPHARGVGGAVGSLLGTPGAALGGMAGEAVNRLATDIPSALQGGDIPTPAESLGRIGAAGLEQGALNVAGGLVSKGAAKVGEKVMGVALKAAPETAKTAIKEGITHTRAGVDKVMKRLGEMGTRTAFMLRQSTAQGTRFPTTDVLAGAEQKLLANLAENRLPSAVDDEAMFTKLGNQFLQVNQNKQVLTPLELQKIKQMADQVADPIFRQLKRKKPIEAGKLAEARWHKALSDFAREELERTTPPIIDPKTGAALSLRDANAETGALIGLKNTLVPEVSEMGLAEQALQRSTRPLAMAGAGAALGAAADEQLPGNRLQGAMLGAGIGAGLSPAALSQQALMLNSPLIQLLLRQTPRGVNELMREE